MIKVKIINKPQNSIKTDQLVALLNNQSPRTWRTT